MSYDIQLKVKELPNLKTKKKQLINIEDFCGWVEFKNMNNDCK